MSHTILYATGTRHRVMSYATGTRPIRDIGLWATRQLRDGARNNSEVIRGFSETPNDHATPRISRASESRTNNTRKTYCKIDCIQRVSIPGMYSLASKAKEADLRKYCEGGVEDAVMDKLKLIREAGDGVVVLGTGEPGPLQQMLTRHKGRSNYDPNEIEYGDDLVEVAFL